MPSASQSHQGSARAVRAAVRQQGRRRAVRSNVRDRLLARVLLDQRRRQLATLATLPDRLDDLLEDIREERAMLEQDAVQLKKDRSNHDWQVNIDNGLLDQKRTQLREDQEEFEADCREFEKNRDDFEAGNPVFGKAREDFEVHCQQRSKQIEARRAKNERFHHRYSAELGKVHEEWQSEKTSQQRNLDEEREALRLRRVEWQSEKASQDQNLDEEREAVRDRRLELDELQSRVVLGFARWEQRRLKTEPRTETQLSPRTPKRERSGEDTTDESEDEDKENQDPARKRIKTKQDKDTKDRDSADVRVKTEPSLVDERWRAAVRPADARWSSISPDTRLEGPRASDRRRGSVGCYASGTTRA